MASQAYLLASQASRCVRPGLELIALASQWLRRCFVASSHWLQSGFAGVFAGLAGFTLRPSWPCDYCASFPVAALWPCSGFVVASQWRFRRCAGLAGFTLRPSWPCVHSASFAVAALWLCCVFALATHLQSSLPCVHCASFALSALLLRSSFAVATHWQSRRCAGLAGFTMHSSWPCIHCASFAVAPLWPRSGFALASQWLRRRTCWPRRLYDAFVLAMYSLR